MNREEGDQKGGRTASRKNGKKNEEQEERGARRTRSKNKKACFGGWPNMLLKISRFPELKVCWDQGLLQSEVCFGEILVWSRAMVVKMI